MNKTFLKILKYLGVALIGAFVGIGALVGVSSCEAKKVESANAETNTIKGGVYRTNSYIDITNYYRIVPSSYDFNSFYISIYGDNYAWGVDYGNYKIIEIDIYCLLFTDNNQRYLTYDRGSIAFSYGGEIERTDLWEQQYGNYDYYYGTNEYTRFFISSSSTVNLSLSSENVSQSIQNTLISYFYEDFNRFFTPIVTPSFTFYDSWNYNAPYLRTTNDLFITDSFSSSEPSQVIRKEYYYYYGFISNGEFYDKISLTYVNGIGTRYYSNGVHTNTNDGYGYFSTLIYYNTSTGSSKFVCQRNFTQRQDGSNGLQTCLDVGSVWINNNYQKLLFLGPLANDENTSLAQFNNNLDVNGLSSSGSDIGLSNVFTLIAHAFASWIPIFNIQIVPGVTVGLLMFLPLITGIILLIIWIVKR